MISRGVSFTPNSSARISLGRRLSFLLLLPVLAVSCSEINEAGDTVYDGIFQKSRQRRIDKDTANLKAGRPLQYYHSPADLHRARTTGRD